MSVTGLLFNRKYIHRLTRYFDVGMIMSLVTKMAVVVIKSECPRLSPRRVNSSGRKAG